MRRSFSRQCIRNLPCALLRHPLPCLLRVRADVRGQHKLGQRDQPRRNVRLIRVHVQPRAAQMFRFQRIRQCVAVHNRPARRVDEDAPLLHSRQRRTVKQPARLLRQRAVQGQHVRLRQQLRQGHAFHLRMIHPVPAVPDAAHSERRRDFRRPLADAPTAEQTQRLSAQTAPHVSAHAEQVFRRFRPHAEAVFPNSARNCKHQPDGELRRAVRHGVGQVRDRYAAFRRCAHVHAVIARAIARDNAQLRPPADDFARQRAARNDRIRRRNQRREFVL